MKSTFSFYYPLPVQFSALPRGQLSRPVIMNVLGADSIALDFISPPNLMIYFAKFVANDFQMNKNQKTIFEKISKGREPEILNELFAFYLDKGLGTVTKQNLDVFIFYLMEKYQKASGEKLSNYQWSSLLKISETKIKNLRLQAGISFSSDEDHHDMDLWIDLLDTLRENAMLIENGWIMVTIENPALLRFLEHQLKTAGKMSPDFSFNKEIVKFKVDALENLVKLATGAIGADETYAETKIGKAKWDAWKKKAVTIATDIGKSMPGSLLKLLLP